uniref:Mei2-like C-terminal RNA recognition motif domain-containing protein n=1 Tax=Peronospora matthiolae TaxID=2874970 RepID=A0AAV1UE18_9STRA
MTRDNVNSNDHHSPTAASSMYTPITAAARHARSRQSATNRFSCSARHAPDATRGYNAPTASPPTSPAAPATRQSLLTHDALWGFDDALAQSLRALTCAPSSADVAQLSGSDAAMEKRPRSFSDYAVLSGASCWRAHGERSELGALWDAMRTDCTSRHVVVRCGAGTWDAVDVRRVVDRLNQNFGSVARTCRELTAHGLLFCTFFDLASAVAAVDCWRADVDVISFCLPYELPEDINSAALLVRFTLSAEPHVTASDVRQVCTCFGPVASVLPCDSQGTKYVVEYSDSRALPAALNGLHRAFNTSGSVSVARTTPPTLDVLKLKLFQECLNWASTTHPRVTRARPKSFSSSTASILTSPTSSVASSLNASCMDTASTKSPPMTTCTSAELSSARDVTSPMLMPQTEQHIWARPAPRCRSNSSSSYRGGSLASGRFDGPQAHCERFTISSPCGTGDHAHEHTFFQDAHRFQPLNSTTFPLTAKQQGYQQQHEAYSDRRGRERARTMSVPMRSGFDSCEPFYQPGVAHNGVHVSFHGGTAVTRSSIGRHDQGTGEFSLSIEKVASGEDKRTTLMIRNIPNKYTQQMLLTEINRNHRGGYDFFYLPIDFKNKCNMGYAFINFIEAAHIKAFHQEFDGQKWTNFNSEKVCAISYARLQGKQAMIARFQNSSLLEKHESYRPLVFGSFGSNRGKPEPFPTAKPIAQRRQSMCTHSPGMFKGDDYGNYIAHQMYSQQQPSHESQHVRYQHPLAAYPQGLVDTLQYAMPPLPTANWCHVNMQTLPLQYVPSYQQNNSQLMSPILYRVAEIPSNSLDHTR